MQGEELWRCVSVVGTPSRWRLNARQDYKIHMMDKINPVNFENLSNPVTIGVVGAGTMGNGIAQVSARAGYNVIMHDVRDEFLDRGLKAIDKNLQRDVDKERLDVTGKQG